MRQDQKRIFKLISRAEALERTLASVKGRELGHESVSVAESCGRVLAEDIAAPHDLPPYSKAGMDGYAVRSKDAAKASSSNPVRLVIAGKLFPPDRPSAGRVVKGRCAYTATGAPLPEGSDAVVQVEKTRLVKGAIEIVQPVAPNENVSLKGEQAKQGETLFKRGDVVCPLGIGILLTLGVRSVGVVRKPRMGIISVGDELADAYEESESRVVNDHAYIVSDLLRQLGAEPKILGVVPDYPELIQAKISDAFRRSDIVITIGGSSVGTKDFVPTVVSSLGRTLFHGVTIAPGKVTGLGVIDGKPIVMLPGYLMSALAGFYLFVIPLVNVLLGSVRNGGLPVVDAKLNKTARSKQGLERFQILRLSRHGKSYLATPVEGQSGAMVVLNRANAYTIIPKGQVMRQGEHVAATLFAPSEFRRMPIEN
ncbi:molybdopterin molybdotransferase MoeA [[Eubacterium] cellulosolvens]